MSPHTSRSIAVDYKLLSIIRISYKDPTMQDGLTAAWQSAIKMLIRTKSDREIGRLLRKSYNLLNLHRRRRSSVSHRERWTDYELRLLGRIGMTNWPSSCGAVPPP